MTKYAVVKTGGKQYLVKDNDEIVVDKIDVKANNPVDLEVLASFDDTTADVEMGSPLLKSKIKANVMAQLKGDKLRVSKFRAKVRYRKSTGFRPQLTRIKITKI